MIKLHLSCRTMAAVASVSLFTLLAITATADAQDIAAVRRAVVSGDGSLFIFTIDSPGRSGGRTNLEITRLDSSGSFVGLCYPSQNSPRPSSPNLTGTITITRGTAGGANGIKITASTSSTSAGGLPGGRGLVSTTTYEGAMRLGSASNQTFIAGTSSFSGPGSSGGPYPFCAKLDIIPP